MSTSTIEESTASTEAAVTTPLPATEEAWRITFDAEFQWGTDTGRGAAAFFHSQATQGMTEMPPIDTFIDAFKAAVPTYNVNESDNERLYSWTSDLVEQATVGTVPVTPDEVKTVDMVMSAVLPDHPEDLLVMSGTSERNAKAYREVLRYQFGNWKRGKYMVTSGREGFRQFQRRMSREYGYQITASRDEHYILAAIKEMLAFVKDPAHEIVSPAPTHNTCERMLSGHGLFPDNEGNGVYYAANFMSNQADLARRAGTDPLELASKAEDALTQYLKGCFTWNDAFNESVTRVIDLLGPYVYPVPMAAAEPDANINDHDTLLAWQMELHTKVGEFGIRAIQNGIHDFVDQAAAEGFKENTALTPVLRRMVGQYGYVKYTGKERRSVLEANLQQVAGALKGKGLTQEQWAERWARRDVAVSYVSGRYGEQNNLCSVLEQATAELGIDPMRKPKHKVRFQGSGVIVEVEVETWYDEGSALLSQAREKWSMMSDEAKKAAIIETVKPYVNWADMSTVH